MKSYIFLFFLFITFNLTAGNFNHNQQPYIEYKNGIYILNLPAKMLAALNKFNALFVHWDTNDYTAKILSDLKKENSTVRAPFALIVDVNKDGKPDVVLDGHDNEKSLLICILSYCEEYEVLLIDKHPITYPQDLENYNDGKKEVGLNYYLWLNKQNGENNTPIFTLAVPQQSNDKGILLRDGFIIDYYFKDGKFEAEKQIL